MTLPGFPFLCIGAVAPTYEATTSHEFKPMPQKIKISETGGDVILEQQPDHCPICHTKIAPLIKFSKGVGIIYRADVEVVYLCPNTQCNEFFIAYFVGAPGGPCQLTSTRPAEPVPVTFADPVEEISQNFCDIYREAHKAEEFGLKQICGVGYRKAFEFLIKDYLIGKRPADKASIERTMLGTCIENYVTDPRIKEIAKRATWLGNDETHYQRRWIDKDLSNLKTLIRLALHWIEAEHLTEEALKSMPAPAKP